MDQDQESFLNELLDDFKIEASEHYQAIIAGLIVLEKTDDISIQKSEIEKIFREVHSLKGASRAVNLMDIEKLCMSLETVFNSLKKGESTLSPPLFDAFHKATDLLFLLLTDINQNSKNKGSYNLNQICRNIEFAHKNSIKSGENSEIIRQDSAIEINVQKEKIKVETPIFNPIINQTVRISVNKLSSLLIQSEELLSIKSTFNYFAKELQNMNHQYSIWNRNQISRDEGIKDIEFRKKHESELSRIYKEIAKFQHDTGLMIDELLHDIKTTLLFPFSSMLGIFPKLVRDLSKEYSKDIELVISGDSIEIDRRILEELKDPLIHLIRNSIDHGIENSNDRLKKGKPAKGKIELTILQNIDKKIQLLLKDDGEGLDKTKIVNEALKSGILKQTEVEKLSDKEIYSLIFQSGLSTSSFITTISGRGLGMAIVAEKVNNLGGSIELETTKDVGTTFILSLPQTLSTFRGILLKTAEQHFIIPSLAVERAIRIKYADIKTVESRKTICYNDETIALTFLWDVLKITTAKKKNNTDDYLQLIILSISKRKIAFVVDEILGEHEGIVKDLGLQLSHVTNIAGATILGNGRVVPILNPSELIDTASQNTYSTDYLLGNAPITEDFVQKRILVSEDSITIRTLLRNFIENAGFYVKTTVDGMEAYEVLQNETFDLIVSDIEMPRMNGFELTAKIRENSKYTDLPIILVTALETADDRQRGLEVGANAYIIKSSFEKSNLIETIQRLI